MTTQNEMIAILRAQNPDGLRTGNEVDGYTDLTGAEYEATLADWADARLAQETKAEAEAQAATDKAALLAKLGITADELKTLLS